MPYIADMSVVETNGNGKNFFGESYECVASVKKFTGAPKSTTWKRGVQVKGNLYINKGTAIATFKSDTEFKGHSAIYVSQNFDGIWVYDQYPDPPKKFSLRFIQFRGNGYIANDGDQFYVIE